MADDEFIYTLVIEHKGEERRFQCDSIETAQRLAEEYVSTNSATGIVWEDEWAMPRAQFEMKIFTFSFTFKIRIERNPLFRHKDNTASIDFFLRYHDYQSDNSEER